MIGRDLGLILYSDKPIYGNSMWRLGWQASEVTVCESGRVCIMRVRCHRSCPCSGAKVKRLLLLVVERPLWLRFFIVFYFSSRLCLLKKITFYVKNVAFRYIIMFLKK